MPVSFGQTEIPSNQDVSFGTRPLLQMSFGNVIVWERIPQVNNSLMLTIENPVDTLVLPLTQYNGQSYTVNWGDGTTNTNTNSHTYRDGYNRYYVVITGNCAWGNLHDTTKIILQVSPTYQRLVDSLVGMKIYGLCPIRQFTKSTGVGDVRTSGFAFCKKLRAYDTFLLNNLVLDSDPSYTSINGKQFKCYDLFYNAGIETFNPAIFGNIANKDAITTYETNQFFTGCPMSFQNDETWGVNFRYNFSRNMRVFRAWEMFSSTNVVQNVNMFESWNTYFKYLLEFDIFCMFFNCKNYIKASSNLFKTLPTTLERVRVGAFSNSGVKTIDEDILKHFPNSVKSHNFDSMFTNTPITSIPSTMFSNTNIPNASTTTLTSMFAYCSKITGALPTIWNNYSKALHLYTFNGCTNASNYSAVPDNWKNYYTQYG